MAIFGKKTDSGAVAGSISVQDEILGYFDELIRLNGSIEVNSGNKTWTCSAYLIEDKKKTLRIQDQGDICSFNSSKVSCGFAMDKMWFVFNSKIVVGDNKPNLILPEYISPKERRKFIRTRLTTRETVKATIMEGFGMGIGVTGTVKDIGLNGACLDITRCMQLEKEKDIKPHQEVIKPGKKLAFIKISGLPGVPTVEIEGVNNRITRGASWQMAVEFKKIPEKISRALNLFIEPRCLTYEPVKRSRKKRLEVEGRQHPAEDQQQAAEMKQTPQQPRPVEKKDPVMPAKKDPVSEKQSVSVSVDNFSAQYQLRPGQLLLSIGDDVKENLGFLKQVSAIDWIHGDNPVFLSRSLREKKIDFLVVSVDFRNQNMLDFLEKMSLLGILGGVRIFLFSDRGLAPGEVIKCKILGVKSVMKFPLEDQVQFLKKLIGVS